jgi:hypothetical protein
MTYILAERLPRQKYPNGLALILAPGIATESFRAVLCAKLAVESPPGRPKIYPHLNNLPDIANFFKIILI